MVSNQIRKWRDLDDRQGCKDLLTMFEQMLEAHLPYMVARSDRVEQACKIIGEALESERIDLFALALAARVHDIGLLGIPDRVLLKEGSLSDEEMTAINQHTDLGGRLLAKAFPDFPEVAEGIWFHHERPDGKGPHGLKGEEIPIIAAIISLVAGVEAMANVRPYRKPMKLPGIIYEITLNAGTQFTHKVVSVFLSQADRIYAALLSKGEVSTNLPLPMEPGVRKPSSQTILPKGQGNNSSDRAGKKSTSTDRFAPRGDNKPAPVPSPGSPGEKSFLTLSPIISMNDLTCLVKENHRLKSFAGNVHNLMAVTQNPNCSVDDVAKEITLDQSLTLRVLKMANSSVYTMGKPINNIKAAVGRIGVREVRNLVMTLNVIQQYEGQISQYLDPQHFWEHSIGCGLIAPTLAKACHSKSLDDYFLSGIMHDIGRLVFLDQLVDKYTVVWETANQYELPLEVVEAKLILMNHCDILQQVLDNWNFPHDFIIPIANHHKPAVKIKQLGPNHILTTAVISLADKIAHALLLGSSGNEVIYPLDDLVEMLELRKETLSDIEEHMPEETQSMRFTMLARSDSMATSDFVSLVQKRLKANFLPICVSLQPWSDSLRMFCRRIQNRTGNNEPNLGVIYLREDNEWSRVSKQYEAQEREMKCEVLPIVIVCAKGQIKPDPHWMKARRHVILNAPVQISCFINAINTLLCLDKLVPVG